MQLEHRIRARRVSIGLTPLIDVVFILLLFFMLASSLSRLHTVPVVVAGAPSPTAATDSPRPALLRVLAAGGLELDGRRIAAEQLDQALAERQVLDPRLRLVVEPEDAVALQRLLDVLDAAAHAGVSAVRLQ